MNKLFKKGDLVKVRSYRSMKRRHHFSGIDLVVEGIHFSKFMHKFCGQIGVIVSNNTNNSYRIKFNGKKTKANYYFSKGMLKKAKCKSFLNNLSKRYNKSVLYNKKLL